MSINGAKLTPEGRLILLDGERYAPLLCESTRGVASSMIKPACLLLQDRV
jgi:hypothetical protein